MGERSDFEGRWQDVENSMPGRQQRDFQGSGQGEQGEMPSMPDGFEMPEGGFGDRQQPGGGRQPGGQGNTPQDGGFGMPDTPPQGMDWSNGNGMAAGTSQNGDTTGYIVLIATLLLLLAGGIIFIAKPRKTIPLKGSVMGSPKL